MPQPNNSVIRNDETWEFDGASWTQIAVTGPAPRYGHSMTYDADRGVVLLFGGNASGGGSSYRNDVWQFDGAAWTELDLAQRPPGSMWSALAYDTVRGRAVMFGGGTTGSRHAETWALADDDEDCDAVPDDVDACAATPLELNVGPDGCPLPIVGDVNCDFAVTLDDAAPLVEALVDPTNFTGCELSRADLNGDGLRDGRDIEPFVDILLHP
ncbi:MAG: hypothetical protein IPK83_07440 [Planctomycetes bacterium]|nr:hypothetical protein [Planctomycetota bacterium]